MCDKACALGVVQSSEGLKGTVETWNGVEVYVTHPAAGTELNKIVVLFHDIYGFGLPNTRHATDYMAGHGFLAVMPNTLGDDSWDENRSLASEDFGAWWNKWTENFPLVLSTIKKVTSHLKSAYPSQPIGAMGFCWGGRQIDLIARHPVNEVHIGAGALLHAGLMDGPSITNALFPLKFIVTEDDAVKFPEKYERTVQAVADVKAANGLVHEVVLYKGMQHGFANRGNYKDEHEWSETKRARDEAAEWLKKNL